MDGTTIASVILGALGVVGALVAMHRHALGTVLPREVDRLIAAITTHERDAKRRHRKSVTRFKRLRKEVKELRLQVDAKAPKTARPPKR